jgi:hypothetical protein
VFDASYPDCDGDEVFGESDCFGNILVSFQLPAEIAVPSGALRLVVLPPSPDGEGGAAGEAGANTSGAGGEPGLTLRTLPPSRIEPESAGSVDGLTFAVQVPGATVVFLMRVEEAWAKLSEQLDDTWRQGVSRGQVALINTAGDVLLVREILIHFGELCIII